MRLRVVETGPHPDLGARRGGAPCLELGHVLALSASCPSPSLSAPQLQGHTRMLKGLCPDP